MENLFFKRLHSSKRTYFINVLKNDNNQSSIQIIESKAIKKGQYERVKINIREEDGLKFIKILEEAIEVLKKNK